MNQPSRKEQCMARSNLEPRESMSRLALNCSALARAGQVLRTVTDPARTGDAAAQAAAILEGDGRGSALPQLQDVARECRSALEGLNVSERLAVCRKLATKLARLASTMATEVQEQTRRAAQADAKPAARTPAVQQPARVDPAPAPAAPNARPDPAPAIPAAVPEGRKPKVEKRPSRSKTDAISIRVAITPEERAAVAAALETKARFASVAGRVVVDLRTELMWAAALGPAGTHREADVFSGGCALGGYRDWRLPRPEELQQFLTGGGRDLPAFGVGPGRLAEVLWTSDVSRKWFIFRQATVVEIRSALAKVISARRRDAHVLVVRSAPIRQ